MAGDLPTQLFRPGCRYFLPIHRHIKLRAVPLSTENSGLAKMGKMSVLHIDVVRMPIFARPVTVGISGKIDEETISLMQHIIRRY